jgi:hypothetical protein
MPEPHDTCVRCRETDVSGPFSLCAACADETSEECSKGLVRLGRYLAAWAAFDEWLRDHGRSDVGAAR